MDAKEVGVVKRWKNITKGGKKKIRGMKDNTNENNEWNHHEEKKSKKKKKKKY